MLRLLICRDHLPWCRKYDDRTLVHAASLIRNQRNLNVATELNLYRNTAQTCPELHLLHDSKSVEVIFMVPHHTTCVSSENVFLLQKMRNEFSVFFFSPYSFLLLSPPLHCFLLDFVYNNVENYLHPKRTQRVLSFNSNDTTFR